MNTQQAYLLHRRPYRETSAIARFWVKDVGLISAVVKGVHGLASVKKKENALRNAWLQPFQLLALEISGQGDLKQVYKFEPLDAPLLFTGDLLLAGQYINQLLIRSLTKYEVEPPLFLCYQQLLQNFDFQQQTASSKKIAIELRCFEKQLLYALGFALDWVHDAEGAEIKLGRGYSFTPGTGFELFGQIHGDILHAINGQHWSHPGALSVAREVIRQQLEWCFDQPLLVPSVGDRHEV